MHFSNYLAIQDIFSQTIQGISKPLFLLFNYILESSVDWFLQKQSEIFWKCINFTPLDYNINEGPLTLSVSHWKIEWWKTKIFTEPSNQILRFLPASAMSHFAILEAGHSCFGWKWHFLANTSHKIEKHS